MWYVEYSTLGESPKVLRAEFNFEKDAKDYAKTLFNAHGIKSRIIAVVDIETDPYNKNGLRDYPSPGFKEFTARERALLNSSYGKMGIVPDAKGNLDMEINRKYAMTIGPAGEGGFVVFKKLERDNEYRNTTEPYSSESIVFAGDLDQCLTFLKDTYGENGRNKSRF